MFIEVMLSHIFLGRLQKDRVVGWLGGSAVRRVLVDMSQFFQGAPRPREIGESKIRSRNSAPIAEVKRADTLPESEG